MMGQVQWALDLQVHVELTHSHFISPPAFFLKKRSVQQLCFESFRAVTDHTLPGPCQMSQSCCGRDHALLSEDQGLPSGRLEL